MALKKPALLNVHKIQHDLDLIKYLNLEAENAGLIENLKLVSELIKSSGKNVLKVSPDVIKLLGEDYFNPKPRKVPEREKSGALNLSEMKITVKKFSDGKMAAVIVDNIFTESTLNKLRSFCVESHFWSDIKLYRSYLLTDKRFGFQSPLLKQIDREMRSALKSVLKNKTLADYWAIKYDSNESGIPVHVDGAYRAITCNFWITPTEENLNSKSGGMVIYNLGSPSDWTWPSPVSDDPKIESYIKKKKPEKIVVPYKGNRAVLFFSRNFHKTNAVNFKPNFSSRRVSITFIYQEPGTPVTKY